MKKLIVVSDPADWPLDTQGAEIITAADYIRRPEFTDLRNARVFNLCRGYGYQTTGYYVSLLAEARGHRPVPSVTTIQDLRSPMLLRNISDDLGQLIERSLARIKSDEFVLSIYFGRNVAAHYDRLAKELSNLFPAPLLRARFSHSPSRGWILQGIRLIAARDIPDSHLPLAQEFATDYFGKSRRIRPRQPSLYDLAILVNPHENAPPSNRKALDRFAEAAARQRFGVEFIERDDYGRLGEFDALFIRETTAVNHHTYRFARRAAADGLAVIDDPLSIVRCANKVYLAEIFAKHRIPSPPTVIVHEGNRRKLPELLEFPIVLKQPDSSFSQGVVKVEDPVGLKEALSRMLAASDLVIAQAFTPSDFDWRIGILDRRPLYACKYFMARNHWQIYNWSASQRNQSGRSETIPVDEAPPAVVRAALQAANLIGDGFYGVDVKELGGRACVIEVNDNPSVESGVEDVVLKRDLYDSVIGSLRDRIEQLRFAATAP